MAGSYYCEKCNRTMGAEQFYTSNNLEAYPPDGKLHLCKKCITMHVDNWNPETYLWILKEVDVPYIPKEWNKLLASYGKDKSKVTGLTILGRYLSKMKLNQYKKYRWDDTEHLQAVENKTIEETMLRQGYSMAEIDDVLRKGTFEVPTGDLTPPPPPSEDPTIGVAAEDLSFGQQIEDDLISDLTDEDRKYLCVKWGKAYRPDEWVRLEELYNQMLNSYDIQQAGDLNTLKMVCKTSLKANQLLDLGDVDGAQKMGKLYDTLMKQGKWTAAQNKTEENEMIDSVGELVILCEKAVEFIPKYYVDGPQDKADRVLQDMQKYTKDLVDNESSLGVMMERASVQMAEEEARIAAAAETGGETDEEAMFNYDKPAFDLEDYSEFKDFEAAEIQANENYFMSLLEGEADE